MMVGRAMAVATAFSVISGAGLLVIPASTSAYQADACSEGPSDVGAVFHFVQDQAVASYRDQIRCRDGQVLHVGDLRFQGVQGAITSNSSFQSAIEKLRGQVVWVDASKTNLDEPLLNLMEDSSIEVLWPGQRFLPGQGFVDFSIDNSKSPVVLAQSRDVNRVDRALSLLRIRLHNTNANQKVSLGERDKKLIALLLKLPEDNQGRPEGDKYRPTRPALGHQVPESMISFEGHQVRALSYRELHNIKANLEEKEGQAEKVGPLELAQRVQAGLVSDLHQLIFDAEYYGPQLDILKYLSLLGRQGRINYSRQELTDISDRHFDFIERQSRYFQDLGARLQKSQEVVEVLERVQNKQFQIEVVNLIKQEFQRVRDQANTSFNQLYADIQWYVAQHGWETERWRKMQQKWEAIGTSYRKGR